MTETNNSKDGHSIGIWSFGGRGFGRSTRLTSTYDELSDPSSRFGDRSHGITISTTGSRCTSRGVSPIPLPPPLANPEKLAQIVPGDTVAQSIWQSIRTNPTYATALSIPPSVIQNEAPVFTSYDTATDPNCWWSASGCKAPKQSYLPPGKCSYV